ncbi:HNH endonuclease [Planctomycetales bacterium ZRK34]|nr:HNH endonuclease [Planctomycetales bacterium ZRK34]
MAIRVTSARRAFSLLCREMAEVIAVDDGSYASYDFDSWLELSRARDQFSDDTDWVRTVRMHIAVPKVIRLLGYDRLPAQTVKLNRRNLYARDRNMCQYCGQKFPTSELTLDHVVPRRLGGKSTWTNLVCACVACNSRKGGRTPTQAHMKLITKPHQPKRNPVINLRLGQNKYSCWQSFLDSAYWSVELK